MPEPFIELRLRKLPLYSRAVYKPFLSNGSFRIPYNTTFKPFTSTGDWVPMCTFQEMDILLIYPLRNERHRNKWPFFILKSSLSLSFGHFRVAFGG